MQYIITLKDTTKLMMPVVFNGTKDEAEKYAKYIMNFCDGRGNASYEIKRSSNG